MANRVVYFLIAVIVVLGLALAAAVGALVWKYSSLANGLDNLEACKTRTTTNINILELYPKFFRTPAEQAEFTKQYKLFQQSRPSYVTYRPDYCSLNCSIIGDFNVTGNSQLNKRSAPERLMRVHSKAIHDSRARKERQTEDEVVLDGPFYHACCQSYKVAITPETATSLGGDTVDIVQLPAMNEFQYFIEEHCEEETTCSNCECEQPSPFVYEALIYKDKDATLPEDRFDYEFVQFPGSCKCLNIGKRRRYSG